MDADMTRLGRSRGAEVVPGPIVAIKQSSANATTVAEFHELLGHLATIGRLLPDAFTDIAQNLVDTVDEDEGLQAAVSTCQSLLDEAADLAYRAGAILRRAQVALTEHV